MHLLINTQIGKSWVTVAFTPQKTVKPKSCQGVTKYKVVAQIT